MKRLKLCLLALIICFGLCGCEGVGFTSIRRYADCMNRNWHLNLPETDVEIYVKNSGASFTGDGIRYHILQYDEESADIIIKSFDWEAGELNSELADKMDEWHQRTIRRSSKTERMETYDFTEKRRQQRSSYYVF